MSDKDDTCTLSDSDLIDKCHQWISDLAESGGKKWTLRVPVDMNNDPDMLFAELCDRFTGRRPRRPEHRPENPDGFARRENIFDAIARERMESYELRGFKRVFAALYGVIHSAMQEYADGETAALRAALEKIARWELPSTGQFWDRARTEPMSYEGAYGSNGARDYIRTVARETLAGRGPETQNADALTVLKELVALEDLKEAIESNPRVDIYDAIAVGRGLEEYNKRKAEAWAAARKLPKP